MDERDASGRDRDRDRDAICDRECDHDPTRPASPQTSQQSSLPRPLLLDHRTGSQAPSTHMPLPPLPESPLTELYIGASTPKASSFRPIPRAVASTPSETPALPNVQATIRSVTPEPFDQRRQTSQSLPDTASELPSSTGQPGRTFGSPQSSPRSIPGTNSLSHHGDTRNRRQGVVFSDAGAGSFDSTSSSPPPRPPVFRHRTHTMDGTSPFREPPGVAPTSEPRNRVSSFSSSGTADISMRLASTLQGPPLENLSYPLIAPNRSSEAQVTPISTSVGGTLTTSSSAVSITSLGGTGFVAPSLSTPSLSREKKGSNRRLIKRTSSRPTSPLVSAPPSVDSLPLPIPTDDANKVLMLMKTLCGRMRGEIEYRSISEGLWSRGISYIEEENGSLMFDAGENSPFLTTIVPDLRGCRITPVDRPDKEGQYLELVNAQSTIEIVIRPILAVEFDLWLAALLCWQQVRQAVGVTPAPNTKPLLSRTASGTVTDSIKRRGSAAKAKDVAIIKVGKVMLWDKGVATTPRAVLKRPSTRDLKATQSSWRRVSCILQNNGEIKFATEHDVTILSVVELSQLARCAIQQLDKSVLDEEYCIAIFPIYAATSSQLSIFRPVYIALDSRVAFEVWFVLFRAFAIPDVYALDMTDSNEADEIASMGQDHGKPEPTELQFMDLEPSSAEPPRTQREQFFRLEKWLNLRITEAKIKPRSLADGSYETPNRPNSDRPHEKQSKNDHYDPLIGNYLAEVILDGEVRARTTTKCDTKNPFWREDCEFSDLPSTLPFLSVILKRVDGNLDSFTHQLQASLGLPKTGNLREVMYGSVDIPLQTLEKGKEHEQWLPIMDDRKKTVGSMLIKVHHEELAVLSGAEYEQLSLMLHRFSAGLTLQIAEVMPGSLRRLAEVFLNIFQVSGSASDWLMALVEDEIDGIGNQATMKKMRFSRRLVSNESMESSSDREQIVRDMGRSLQGEANLLFRGNSLLTQALEFHMRRLGKEYLEEVLSDKIFEINEINPDCEVDPSKIHSGDDVSKHWEQLMLWTNDVWGCIVGSASRFPPELRHILKYIRAVADDRYGDFLRTVSYTSVSGFLFLRFICPAILNPKLFGLLRDHPQPRAQRTFTLIAKGLQALANLNMIGKKETWMEPMNRFLAAQRQSVKDFIDSVCSIPAEKLSAAPIVPASYSTPTTIMGRLPAASREGFPSLPYLIDHSRSFAALIKLWMDAYPHDGSASVFEGELLEFNEACLALQAKANACWAQANRVRPAAEADVSELAADDTLAGTMDKASLASSINVSYGSSSGYFDSTEGGSNTNSLIGGAGVLGHRSIALAPPGSSGSEIDDQQGRDPKSRQMSMGSNSGHQEAGGSIKMLRNGKHTRKFLSGFISRKPRATSPDHISESLSGTPLREHDNKDQRRRERGKDSSKDRDRDRDRGRGYDGNGDRKGEHNKRPGSKDKPSKRDKSAKSEKSDKSIHASHGDSRRPSGPATDNGIARRENNS